MSDDREELGAAERLQDYWVFGEYGEVNPSINDSATYTFLDPARMEELFEHEIEGCFLYSRHWNPSNRYLAEALAALEGTEAALASASGMGAISSSLLQLCSAGDEIVASRTIYGGTYALLKNFLPRFGVRTSFVDLQDHQAVRAAFTERTRVLYCESISNPLLEVADLPALARIAHQNDAKLVVDNTFSPLLLSPARHGADVVCHSLTKFINGTSDCVAGATCASKDFVQRLADVNSGASMLLGPVLDSLRSASLLKNLRTLHLRMRKHSENAAHLAQFLDALGLRVHYPGLARHPQHELFRRLANPGFGFGGMVAVDVGSKELANRLMKRLQEEKVGYLAVSLGYFKTLFSLPGGSTSSEIPAEERHAMGLSDGLVRFSVGLDHDMERSVDRIATCLREVGIV